MASPEELKDQEFNLDSIIGQLFTEEGRNLAIVKAVENGLTNQTKHFQTALQFLEKRGEHKRAYEIAMRYNLGEASRLLELAIWNYEKNEDWLHAAELAEGKDTERAIRNWIQFDDFEKASDLADKLHFKYRAIDYLMQAAEKVKIVDKSKILRLLEKAVKVAERTDDTESIYQVVDKGIEICKRKIAYREGGKLADIAFGIAENDGDKKNANKYSKLARQLYIQEFDYNEKHEVDLEPSAMLAEELGFKERAKRLYRKAINHWVNAYSKTGNIWNIRMGARIAKKIGDKKKADQLYDRAISLHESEGDYVEGAKVAEEKGDIKKRNELYLREIDKLSSKGKYKEAGELFKIMGEPKKAVEMFDAQIKVYESEGRLDSAADLLEKMQEFEKADAYRMLHNKLK